MTNKIALTLLCATVLSSTSYAQTWVSNSGNDNNICSVASPCATFQRALQFTPAFGQVSVLNPGDYGTLSITQSVTIDGGGFASHTSTSGTAITVNAPGGVVQLRNLSVHGNGAQFGIFAESVGHLLIENVKVNGFTQNCIEANLVDSSTDNVVIKDTSIDNCSGWAIFLGSVANTNVKIINTHTNFTNGGVFSDNAFTAVYHSTFSGTMSTLSKGISQNGGTVILDDCLISDWNEAIIESFGGNGDIQLNGNTISHNTTALVPNGGVILSNRNNSFYENGQNGPSTAAALQ